MTAREVTGSLSFAAGKTCSLFGSEPATAEYYRKISALADCVPEKSANIYKSYLMELAIVSSVGNRTSS